MWCRSSPKTGWHSVSHWGGGFENAWNVREEDAIERGKVKETDRKRKRERTWTQPSDVTMTQKKRKKRVKKRKKKSLKRKKKRRRREEGNGKEKRAWSGAVGFSHSTFHEETAAEICD